MTSTTPATGGETLSSDILSGKGKRFLVQASDDTATGHQWGVRLYELKAEAGRGDVREVRMHAKVADRTAAVALAEQVINKVKAQLA